MLLVLRENTVEHMDEILVRMYSLKRSGNLSFVTHKKL